MAARVSSSSSSTTGVDSLNRTSLASPCGQSSSL